MTYAAIITHVQPDTEAAPRLACAVALARRFGARLIGLGVEMIQPLAFDNGFYSADADWMIAMRQTIEEQLAAARAVFDRETRDVAEADRCWLSGIDSPTPTLAAASRAADLIVVGGGPRREQSSHRDVDSAELIVQAGRPVLVVPASDKPLTASRIVMAWKDTRETRRALSDAMPFLESAEAVLVMEICEDESTEDAQIRTEDVADTLRRRGAKAEAKVVASGHDPVGVQILDAAAAFGADLIVLGCYGHSRLGEWVFGGVTRDVLAQDDVYLLLSH